MTGDPAARFLANDLEELSCVCVCVCVVVCVLAG
jgi:hypothetical protein